MAEPSKSNRRKGKVKWSKLYTFSCLRPTTTDEQQLLGQPGFSRVVFCNKPELHNVKPHKYPNNYISTTKYNVVTFLPKALFEQFRRVANLYFLLAAILSATSLAPFSSVSMIAPLGFVIGVSMIKEAVEDWSRFLQVCLRIFNDLLIHFLSSKFFLFHSTFYKKLLLELLERSL